MRAASGGFRSSKTCGSQRLPREQASTNYVAMDKHVTPQRLFELARCVDLVDQPEWEHVKECNMCGERFSGFVRQLDGNRSKTTSKGSKTE
jgi:hypothetical protein